MRRSHSRVNGHLQSSARIRAGQWLWRAAVVSIGISPAAFGQITFQAAANITGDSNVLNVGAPVYAYDWNNLMRL
jgi:hypothetical protein